MTATPLDRVIDLANARGWRVRWNKHKPKPGMWEVIVSADAGDIGGYGPSLQEAASNLLRQRLRDVEREAGRLLA